MGIVRRIAYGLVLAGLLPMGCSAGTASGRARERQPKVPVEARIVRTSDALWAQLGVCNDPANWRAAPPTPGK